MKKLNLKKVTLQIENLEGRDAPKTGSTGGICDSGGSSSASSGPTTGNAINGIIAVVADV